MSVLARGATLSAIRERGLRVVPGPGNAGETVTPLVASDDAAELGPQDFVVVAVKAQAMAGVAAVVGPLLGPSTAVLSTLNGVPFPKGSPTGLSIMVVTRMLSVISFDTFLISRSIQCSKSRTILPRTQLLLSRAYPDLPLMTRQAQSGRGGMRRYSAKVERRAEKA